MKYYLWYDNGTGHFDCSSSHETLDAAIKAAKSGYQTEQYITADKAGKEKAWPVSAKKQIENLIHFLDSACAGWDLSGGPPQNALYEELKQAKNGDFGPLRQAVQGLEGES